MCNFGIITIWYDAIIIKKSMHDSCDCGDEKKKKKGGGDNDCKYLIYSDWQKYLVYFVKYLKICTVDLYM